MDNKPEVVTPQNPVTEPVVVSPETPAVEVKEEVVVVEPTPEGVQIPQTELDELKKNAEASSQNFERAKKAEIRVKELEDLPSNQIPSDYDDEKVSNLETKMSEIQIKLDKKDLLEKHPELKETWDDFTKYHAEDENKGMKIGTAAKAFLVDKELLTPKRKGLEKATGGTKIKHSSGMSLEDVADLRKNDGKKYRDLVKKGLITFKKT